MNIDRRHFMKMSGSALAAAPLLVPPALADKGIPRLRITEPLGKPSVIWTTLTTLRPALQATMNCGVEIETITGNDGFAALKAMLGAPSSEVCLFGGAIMATQYIGATAGFDTSIETLTPVAKLSNGFSVAVFAKRGGRLESWGDVVKASKEKPVTLSTLQRNTAAYIAKLMIEHWAPAATRCQAAADDRRGHRRCRRRPDRHRHYPHCSCGQATGPAELSGDVRR